MKKHQDVELSNTLRLYVRHPSFADEIIDLVIEAWESGRVITESCPLVVETFVIPELSTAGMFILPGKDPQDTSRVLYIDYDAGISDWTVR